MRTDGSDGAILMPLSEGIPLRLDGEGEARTAFYALLSKSTLEDFVPGALGPEGEPLRQEGIRKMILVLESVLRSQEDELRSFLSSTQMDLARAIIEKSREQDHDVNIPF